jgi:hypothetical protein
VVLALVSFVIAADTAAQRFRPPLRTAVWIAVAVAATAGPVIQLGFRLHQQLVEVEAVAPLGQRLRLLVQTQDIIPPFRAW